MICLLLRISPGPPAGANCLVSLSEDVRCCCIIGAPFPRPCMAVRQARLLLGHPVAWTQEMQAAARRSIELRPPSSTCDTTLTVVMALAIRRWQQTLASQPLHTGRGQSNLSAAGGLSPPDDPNCTQCLNEYKCALVWLFEATATCKLGGGSFTARLSDAA